ncbi:hypothetical protein AGMMS49938_18090 [Fibrobacterales bacterium]|nr:hypothetical protein AGMMS49938_18090 [Fibrobacterales bacterium]
MSKMINTSLFVAVKNNKLRLVEKLLSQGADIEARDVNGKTPLYCAMEYGHLECVRLLIEKGANIDAKDDNGLAPLRIAEIKDSSEIVNFLKEKISDTDIRIDPNIPLVKENLQIAREMRGMMPNSIKKDSVIAEVSESNNIKMTQVSSYVQHPLQQAIAQCSICGKGISKDYDILGSQCIECLRKMADTNNLNTMGAKTRFEIEIALIGIFSGIGLIIGLADSSEMFSGERFFAVWCAMGVGAAIGWLPSVIGYFYKTERNEGKSFGDAIWGALGNCLWTAIFGWIAGPSFTVYTILRRISWRKKCEEIANGEEIAIKVIEDYVRYQTAGEQVSISDLKRYAQSIVNNYEYAEGGVSIKGLGKMQVTIQSQDNKLKEKKEGFNKIAKVVISLGIVALLVLAVIVIVNNNNKTKVADAVAAQEMSYRQPKQNAIKLNPINITKTEMFYLPIMSSNGFYKFITLEGKNITDAKYLRAYIFQEGRALVQNKDSLWGYIDTKGNTIASGYKQALSFKDGVAWVNDNGTIKALNLDGRVIKTLSSDIISIWSFYEGFSLFSMNGVQTYIDKNYNTISDKYAFFDGNRFQEGAASVSCDNGKYGYIDTQANFTINCIFDEAKTFKNSKAIVRVGENWGAINKQGKYAFGLYSGIEVINHDGELFSYKKKNGGWGWLNSSGQIIIQPTYEEIMSFDDRDITPVKRNGLWGYIDKNGAIVIDAQYAVAYPFFNNRALVKIGDDFVTIDKNGTQDLQTRSQKIDPSYWDIVNTGIVRNPRIMTVEPSIKCSVASLSNAEKMICRSINLAKLDKETDDLYKSILRNNKSVANSQKEFLAKRNLCNDVRCIESVYEVRNNELNHY